MARIRKPKILLIAPTALGPSRAHQRPAQAEEQRDAQSDAGDADHHPKIRRGVVDVGGERHDHADRARPRHQRHRQRSQRDVLFVFGFVAFLQA